MKLILSFIFLFIVFSLIMFVAYRSIDNDIIEAKKFCIEQQGNYTYSLFKSKHYCNGEQLFSFGRYQNGVLQDTFWGYEKSKDIEIDIKHFKLPTGLNTTEYKNESK